MDTDHTVNENWPSQEAFKLEVQLRVEITSQIQNGGSVERYFGPVKVPHSFRGLAVFHLALHVGLDEREIGGIPAGVVSHQGAEPQGSAVIEQTVAGERRGTNRTRNR